MSAVDGQVRTWSLRRESSRAFVIQMVLLLLAASAYVRQPDDISPRLHVAATAA